ncbi:MAG TPA: electron transfer flavoprotein subunit beta/FixA family protein [Syntrophorhabdaceae bacterium]|jgi:electron transfer flavoprotein beta subunit|nr:electron transfer flavoprotein subunit beta/FixA family protein [Syntrophorhabdaceae bacterium]MDI9560783.1 electron transfer flavoprotein subunit beta/FixA family protein [Pseudomonadota bacterium]OQC48747.1 MAG: Electron transfer flavoprotein subunit beta [Deltaproteobacteria bacterium ADurb.Bin026]HOB69666.1 electron transfer flavoprotein subunit beta/FixA family protein [Syntrophorhabdaceae bacterium]HOF58389.1 electron transfer flavoprotein subunit beta/FixA family protein [Syntrophorha
MNLLVFTKRVPATQEEELRIIDDGNKIDLSKVPFKVNDWDNYSVEEAVRIVEKIGGTVTAVSIGDSESDEVLRRAIAMGAKDGFLIETENILHDPNARSTLIYNFLKKEGLPFDAIFTGVQSEDDQFAAVGGILAAKLRIPFVSMVIGIDNIENGYAIVRRELEGGLQERIKISLPCVMSIQTGINEPRYVSIMGIRKASKVERKVLKASDYQENVENMIELTRWVYPLKKEGATLLSPDLENACKELLNILKEKGVYQ